MPKRPETFTVDRMQTPLGEVLLVVDADGAVQALDFADHEARMMRLFKRRHGAAALINGRAPEPVRRAVERYFDGELGALDTVPVETGGTAFQRAVWTALRTIPAGETRSYGQLAAAIGAPRAVRAVGLATGANAVGVIVPCHRVIGADGALTGYAGGLERKRWLLEHERRR